MVEDGGLVLQHALRGVGTVCNGTNCFFCQRGKGLASIRRSGAMSSLSKSVEELELYS